MVERDYKKDLEVDIGLLEHIVSICGPGVAYATRDTGKKLEVAYSKKAITKYEFEKYEDKIDALAAQFMHLCKCTENK